MQQGQLEKARQLARSITQLYQQMVDQDPDNAKMRFNLGLQCHTETMIQFVDGQLDKATGCWERNLQTQSRFMQQRPNDAQYAVRASEAEFFLSSVTLRQGDFGGAARRIDHAVEILQSLPPQTNEENKTVDDTLSKYKSLSNIYCSWMEFQHASPQDVASADDETKQVYSLVAYCKLFEHEIEFAIELANSLASNAGDDLVICAQVDLTIAMIYARAAWLTEVDSGSNNEDRQTQLQRSAIHAIDRPPDHSNQIAASLANVRLDSEPKNLGKMADYESAKPRWFAQATMGE